MAVNKVEFCRRFIRLQLGGDAEGQRVALLLEDVFASLGVGQSDGLGSRRGTLGNSFFNVNFSFLYFYLFFGPCARRRRFSFIHRMRFLW